VLVVEGLDNSGKSTLIRAIHAELPAWQVQGSEGPPKHAGESDERVIRYLAHDVQTIYDRHPCVSQPIYGQMRTHRDPIAPDLIAQFYAATPFFIYCDGGERGMKHHIFNPETDTPEHLAQVKENYDALLTCYRMWAGEHAFLSYRIGDSVSRVVKTVQYLLRLGRV
jgi:hypothetical protein